MYVDALKIPSLLSLTLQEDGIDIVQGIQSILKSSVPRVTYQGSSRSWTAPRLPIDSAGVGSDDKADIRGAMEYIVTIFREPLEAKGACIFSLQNEIDEIVDFYRKYLENQAEDYRKVCYKLYTAHDTRKWPNVILVSKLLFSLPFTNSIVERAFSAMKIVQTN